MTNHDNLDHHRKRSTSDVRKVKEDFIKNSEKARSLTPQQQIELDKEIQAGGSQTGISCLGGKKKGSLLCAVASDLLESRRRSLEDTMGRNFDMQKKLCLSKRKISEGEILRK